MIGSIIHWFTTPYQSDFMMRALAASLLVGVIAPLVGTWVVLRRLSYIGDAMSHATIGGVAIAYTLGISLSIGAIGAGLLMTALIMILSRHPKLKEDALIGIVGVFLFAGGLIVIARSDTAGVDIGHILLGSITTVSPSDLEGNVILAFIVLVCLVVASMICARRHLIRCMPG